MAPDPRSNDLFCGIDIGGTKILAMIVARNGEQLGTATLPTPSRMLAATVVEAMAEATRRAAEHAGIALDALHGTGIAAAGAIDHRNGIVVHSPHISAFRQTPLASMLSTQLKCPACIGNDANMAALAEHRFGAGRGVPDLLFITVSTGIGGGIIANNQLYVGAGGYAGEIGHMTVDAHGPYGKSSTPGAWESLCSGTALVRIVMERMQAGETSSLSETLESAGELTAVDVFAAYYAGDTLARAVVAEAIEYMGAALTSLVNVLNPGMIIIGGGLSNDWDAYIAPAVEIMRRQSFAGIGAHTPVVPPAFGASAGALGAAVLAMDAE